MAGITVNYYNYGGVGNLPHIPSGTVTITPRGNGYEWTLTPVGTYELREKVYCPTFNLNQLSVILPRTQPHYDGALKRHIETGGGYFKNILAKPSDGKPILFTNSDALKLYGFFAEQMEWSPDALASGTAHPDLLAAQARHSAGRGGSRKARRTRRRARRL